jgi:hypothetical protein
VLSLTVGVILGVGWEGEALFSLHKSHRMNVRPVESLGVPNQRPIGAGPSRYSTFWKHAVKARYYFIYQSRLVVANNSAVAAAKKSTTLFKPQSSQDNVVAARPKDVIGKKIFGLRALANCEGEVVNTCRALS